LAKAFILAPKSNGLTHSLTFLPQKTLNVTPYLLTVTPLEPGQLIAGGGGGGSTQAPVEVAAFHLKFFAGSQQAASFVEGSLLRTVVPRQQIVVPVFGCVNSVPRQTVWYSV